VGAFNGGDRADPSGCWCGKMPPGQRDSPRRRLIFSNASRYRCLRCAPGTNGPTAGVRKQPGWKLWTQGVRPPAQTLREGCERASRHLTLDIMVRVAKKPGLSRMMKLPSSVFAFKWACTAIAPPPLHPPANSTAVEYVHRATVCGKLSHMEARGRGEGRGADAVALPGLSPASYPGSTTAPPLLRCRHVASVCESRTTRWMARRWWCCAVAVAPRRIRRVAGHFGPATGRAAMTPGLLVGAGCLALQPVKAIYKTA